MDEIKALQVSHCQSKAIMEQGRMSLVWGELFLGKGFFCTRWGYLRALHVVILGRRRLFIFLCASSTPIIDLLVSDVGPKASAGLVASRPVGNILARGMVRHSFEAESKRNNY